MLAPDPGGVFDRPYVQPLPARPLEPREVRVAVGAAGLNFWDVFRSLGFIEEGLLGREMCGRIVEVGAEVSRVSVGDHVVGMGFGRVRADDDHPPGTGGFGSCGYLSDRTRDHPQRLRLGCPVLRVFPDWSPASGF